MQWNLFHETAHSDRDELALIESHAHPRRHGNIQPINASERVDVLSTSWRIFSNYVATVHPILIPPSIPLETI